MPLCRAGPARAHPEISESTPAGGHLEAGEEADPLQGLYGKMEKKEGFAEVHVVVQAVCSWLEEQVGAEKQVGATSESCQYSVIRSNF